MSEKPEICLGDVLTFADDPLRWKVVAVDGVDNIEAFRIVPLDDPAIVPTSKESAA